MTRSAVFACLGSAMLVCVVAASVAGAELPNGFRPNPRAAKWHDFLCVGGELPRVGDFNGDGRDDIAVFVRDTKPEPGRGDVGVIFSGLTRFTPEIQRFHSMLCVGEEVPVIGDFNGDHKDDVAVFVRDTKPEPERGAVGLSLSQGSYFGELAKWNKHLCVGQQVPLAGDVNGDGRDDIIVFVKDGPDLNPGPDSVAQQQGNVLVALARTTSGFERPRIWHSFFCIGNETPKVADFDGDGKADIATFVPGRGDVYVALSEGSQFGQSRCWRTGWCARGEIPEVGDVNGDHLADLIAFGRTAPAGAGDRGPGNVFTALNQPLPLPQHFGATVKRHDCCCIGNETPVVGEFNGDHLADIGTLVGDTQGGAMRGKAYVALSSFTQPRTWRLKLSSVRINDISENPVIGPSGDEPYFVTVQFRSRFSTPGSTRVWWGNGPYEFASNLKIGANVDIPANMGQYDFPSVQGFTIADGCRLQRPEVIGAMVLCLEHDFSPFSDINDLVAAAIDRGVTPALRRLVETRAIPLTPEATQQLINDSYNLGPQIMNSMQPSTWDIISLLFNAGFDADDFVDYHGFLWLAADPEVEPLLQRPTNLPPKVHFGVLKDTRYEAGAEGPLIFSGGSVDSHAEHASYTVRGALTLQP